MSGNPIYAQRILGGRIFRLLFISPALDQHQGLECYCLPFEIDASPSYEALSYVWGPSELSTELFCNGHSVSVRLELANALKKLRLRNFTRIVWADAICINQEDGTEKSHQVPLMGSIYSLARRVVVWLGHGDSEQIREALRCVRFIAIACRQYDQDHNRAFDNDERHTALNLPVSQFSPTVCSSLQQLFSRPWFSRIWCVQEIYLAKRALVLWGDHEISWEDLGLGASWIFDKIASADEFSSESDPVTFLLRGIDISRADIVRDKTKHSLLETLQNFREFESSNPRDKVYGLFNLVSPRPEVEALKVDYSQSIGEVFADTVLTTIQLYSRLTAFAYITHRPEYDGNDEYRSWAPRWDDLEVARILGVPEVDCAWSACDGREAIMTNKDHLRPEHLCLMGIVYERVLEIEIFMDHDNLKDPGHTDEESEISSPVNTDADSDSDKRHPFLKVWQTIHEASLPPEELSRRVCALARTTTAGTFGERDDYVDYLDTDTRERYYESFRRVIRRLNQLHVSGDEGSYHHDADSKQFEIDAYHTCKQRCMFWTENSLGLGPHCMDVGDIVVVLYGGSTPYVLRPRGDSYLFMGQAYVDNIMHGELVRSLHAGKLHEQVFHLI